MFENHQSLCEKHLIGSHTREQMITPRQCTRLAHHRIRLVGTSEADQDFSFVRTEPNMGQILVCQSGCGDVLIDHNWHACCEGWAYLTPEKCLHAYHTTSAVWRIAWVIYEAGSPHSPLQMLDAPQCVLINWQPLVWAVEGLLHEAGYMNDKTALEQWADLIHLYATRAVGGPVKNARLVEVWNLVEKDLTRLWTLDELALLSNVSKQHFHRLCMKAYGQSPIRRIAHLRIRRAADLLRYTDDAVKSIGYRVGYNDPYAFSVAFKRIMGVSPSQYRQQL